MKLYRLTHHEEVEDIEHSDLNVGVLSVVKTRAEEIIDDEAPEAPASEDDEAADGEAAEGDASDDS